MSRPEDIQAELAALADGTLPAQRREQMLALLADSPELTAELEDQRQAVAIVRTLESVQAPDLLRRSIETAASGARPHARVRSAGALGRRSSLPLLPRLAAAVALVGAAAVALILALGTGGASAPTVLQASNFGLRPATQAAPAESPHNSHLLAASAAGIRYPYWGARFGWQATGARTDSLAGRTVTTVLYTDRHARWIGYSIVSGAALPIPAGTTVVSRHGVSFHIVRSASPIVVTWREAGHTCILTAHGVSAATLVHLAAWERT
jgi:hypothetical protein